MEIQVVPLQNQIEPTSRHSPIMHKKRFVKERKCFDLTPMMKMEAGIMGNGEKIIAKLLVYLVPVFFHCLRVCFLPFVHDNAKNAITCKSAITC